MVTTQQEATNQQSRSHAPLAPLPGRNTLEIPSLQAQMNDQGYCRVLNCLHETLVSQLTQESMRQHPQAVPSEYGQYGTSEDGTWFSGPMRFVSSRPGPWLEWLHRHPDMVALVRDITGQPQMKPTRLSYMYYTDGSFIHLHTDLPGCKVTVLTTVLGQVPPLVVYPELRGMSILDLLEFAQACAGIPAGGVELPFPQGAFAFLMGRETPHRRPEVRTGGKTIGIATLCYRAD